MELDEERRKLLEKVDGKLDENTKTASVIKSLRITLDWLQKRDEAMEEKEEIDDRWNLDG